MTLTDQLSEMPFEWRQCDQWLRDGKPELGWRGDDRLTLRKGELLAYNNGWKGGKWYRKGDLVGISLEVWRHLEDGTDTCILRREPSQWHDIIPSLVAIDPRTPGFGNAFDKIEKQSNLEHKHRADDIAEAQGEVYEHMFSIVQETLHGRPTTRQVGGTDERSDRNLAKP